MSVPSCCPSADLAGQLVDRCESTADWGWLVETALYGAHCIGFTTMDPTPPAKVAISGTNEMHLGIFGVYWFYALT